jgi:uncharacterized membrane protein YoaK (UPF0700 family)
MKKFNYDKQVTRLFFIFGAICGASLGVALPDGNLLVTAFLAACCGLITLALWFGFKKARELFT